MLPCNVVLVGDGDRTHVSIADPRAMMPGDALALLADEAAGRLSEAAGEIGRAGSEAALARIGAQGQEGRTALTSASMAVVWPASVTPVRLTCSARSIRRPERSSTISSAANRTAGSCGPPVPHASNSTSTCASIGRVKVALSHATRSSRPTVPSCGNGSGSRVTVRLLGGFGGPSTN
jgi:hypothetical protein